MVELARTVPPVSPSLLLGIHLVMGFLADYGNHIYAMVSGITPMWVFNATRLHMQAINILVDLRYGRTSSFLYLTRIRVANDNQRARHAGVPRRNHPMGQVANAATVCSV